MHKWILALALLMIVSRPAITTAQDGLYERFQMAAEYSRRHNGEAVLVRMDGDVVFEEYRNGSRADKPHTLTSGTKSFACVMAAAAVQDGLLDLDESVANTITQFQRDPRRSQITVRHLLSLTSGLSPAYQSLSSANASDQYDAALDVPMLSAPGEKFRYGPSHLAVFGEVLSRKLKGGDVVDYLEARVLGPIGAHIGSWAYDSAGNPKLAAGASFTARDWSLFGQFILNGGRWGRQQLVSPEALAECFRGSPANPLYGLTFWLPSGEWRSVGADGLAREMQRTEYMGASTPDIYAAVGSGNQRLYIIPALNMVVVRFGFDDPTWRGADFLSLLLYGHIAG
jgi:CubicO group peptidase (beta-lactamase class C family)